MNNSEFVQKSAQRVRRYLACGASTIRKLFYRLLGARIGSGQLPTCSINWPHKVLIGDGCRIEPQVVFKHDHFWSPGYSIIIGERVFIGRSTEFNIRREVQIGNNTMIAAGCRFIDHDHGFARRDILIAEQDQPEAPISVAEDVWIGANVILLKGVTIGRGAIVAAGSIVNRSIPEYEIWGGVPARKLKERP